MMMNWKGFSRKQSWPNFKVLSLHSHGRTEEKHKSLNHDSRSLRLRFESGTSRIRSKRVNHSTTTFGNILVACPLVLQREKREKLSGSLLNCVVLVLVYYAINSVFI
jgi:hypothetical protein